MADGGTAQEPEMTAEDWIAAFADAAGAEPPTAAEIDAILKLASVAAHSSERRAAPVACFLAGRGERSLEETIELAERVGD